MFYYFTPFFFSHWSNSSMTDVTTVKLKVLGCPEVHINPYRLRK